MRPSHLSVWHDLRDTVSKRFPEASFRLGTNTGWGRENPQQTNNSSETLSLKCLLWKLLYAWGEYWVQAMKNVSFPQISSAHVVAQHVILEGASTCHLLFCSQLSWAIYLSIYLFIFYHLSICFPSSNIVTIVIIKNNKARLAQYIIGLIRTSS